MFYSHTYNYVLYFQSFYMYTRSFDGYIKDPLFFTFIKLQFNSNFSDSQYRQILSRAMLSIFDRKITNFTESVFISDVGKLPSEIY